jgi:muramoyltetrapeptide carboxypeptidase LdcA involved in peptidoglycan recycling
MSNDFYITRLYEKGRERTLVVFQKPDAWDTLEGGTTIPGTLETILDLLPTPVQIKLHDIILIVVDYETWKQMVHQKQLGEGA